MLSIKSLSALVPPRIEDERGGGSRQAAQLRRACRRWCAGFRSGESAGGSGRSGQDLSKQDLNGATGLFHVLFPP
ncbi:hypothetical protein KCP74_00730 [Salmonella enterica subsp. enterica]|nr:hypothetical protein KCP74_00730 [Salmonella enterica subsp. enterica]